MLNSSAEFAIELFFAEKAAQTAPMRHGDNIMTTCSLDERRQSNAITLQQSESFESLERHQREGAFPNGLLIGQMIPYWWEDTAVYMGKQ